MGQSLEFPQVIRAPKNTFRMNAPKPSRKHQNGPVEFLKSRQNTSHNTRCCKYSGENKSENLLDAKHKNLLSQKFM